MGGQIVQGPRLYVCVERPFKSSLWVTPACSWLPDMPYSFHSHSGQFCHHGYGKLEDVVKEAIRKGFKVYGLSEHMPRFEQGELYPEEIEANCSPDILAQIFSDFQEHARYLARKYADQITLLVGTEIEYIHCGYEQHIQALRKSHQIDYIVGSLHHVGGVPIDFSAELYEKALGKHGGHKQLFEAYFDEQFAMLQSIKPEVVGHFDLVRIFAKEENVLPEVWDRIERNVDYVIKYGGIFEINSRAWKKGLQDAYPHKSIIKLIKEKGGRFTLSDDCHGPQDVGLFYDKLAIYLRETGIDVIHYLTRKDGSIVLEQHKHITEDPFWNMVTRW